MSEFICLIYILTLNGPVEQNKLKTFDNLFSVDKEPLAKHHPNNSFGNRDCCINRRECSVKEGFKKRQKSMLYFRHVSNCYGEIFVSLASVWTCGEKKR